ncbi:MAG: DUF4159 domain-containing protein [Candidatus Omnitrophota bacterium]|nr:DUF4159 domain-containing protein [Candidatus Omnitrophota bacterium]
MREEVKKSGSFAVSLFVHIAVLLIIGHIIVMKPQPKETFFEGKILSTKNVSVQRTAKFQPEVKMPQEAATSPTKEITAPERKALAVDRALELPAPSIAKTPEIVPGEMKVGERKEVVSAKPSRATLDFSSKAQVTGSGGSIKGTFIFPISTYSDWDNDPSTIPNLMNEFGRRTKIKVSIDQRPINFDDKEKIFQYPLIYTNGHSNFSFTEKEVENIREYLMRGGFLFIVNDNAQGGAFEESLYKEMKRIFPNSEFQKVPMSHPIYHIFYDFQGDRLPDALYKGLPPEGYAIYYGDRMVVYYLATGDVCDGWTEAEGSKWPGTRYTPTASHNFGRLSQQSFGAGDEGIENSFKIGVNVLVYILSNMP